MSLTRYLRMHPGCTEVPITLRAGDGAFPGAIPMRDPIVERAIADNARHLPYRDGVGDGARPVTINVVGHAKALALQASLPPPVAVSVRKAPTMPPRGRTCMVMAGATLKALGGLYADTRRDPLLTLCALVMTLVVGALCNVPDLIGLIALIGSVWLLHHEWAGVCSEASALREWCIDRAYRIRDAIAPPRFDVVLTPTPEPAAPAEPLTPAVPDATPAFVSWRHVELSMVGAVGFGLLSIAALYIHHILGA